VYILAASALLSSFLALARDRLFAHTFGAGTELDLYYAAFRIPDFLFVAIGSLVSVYILIPELVRRTSSEQKNYIDTIVAGFSILVIICSACALLVAPKLLEVLFPQFAAAGFLPTLVMLTRIMLLQPIFLGFSNILASITQARGRYVVYAASPLLYNIGVICGLIFFYPIFGVAGLAWGVVLGALLHLGIQAPSIVNDGFFRSVPRIREVQALYRTAVISIPRALTLSMNQITFTGLVAIASGLSAGSVAVFMFAYNLMNVPLAVIGSSYSVAAFPTLASALAEGRVREFIDLVSTAARYILFWSLPSVALIIVLRAHIVRVVLGSGSFDWTDTRLTAAVLALLSVSLAAQALVLLLARAYYAAGRTFVPFFVAAVSTPATIYLAFRFTRLLTDADVLHVVQTTMRLEDVSGSTIIALPLAFSFVSIIAALVLATHFEYRFRGFFSRIATSCTHAFLSAIGAATAAYLTLVVVGPLTLSSTLLSVFLRGFAGGVVGLAAAIAIYAVLKNPEYEETVSSVHERLWRTPVSKAQPISSAEEIGPSSPR
jgi:putative peptidoglycan lipid II flippase